MKNLLGPAVALSLFGCMALALGNVACSDDNGSSADLGGLDGPAADQSTADQTTADQATATADQTTADQSTSADAATGTATIGAAGGSLASADNNFHLTVPPGALSQDKTLTITAASTPSFVTEVASTVDTTGGTVSATTSHTSTWCLYHKPTGLIACCYEITDTQFVVPATLEAAYAHCTAMASVSKTELSLAYMPAGT